MKKTVAKTEDEIRRILGLACANREMLILATPYLRFESNFLQMESNAVHARVTMGAEDAMYGLRSEHLSVRFPHATQFLEGGTRLLGFGLVEGHRSLRLAIPTLLVDDDQRGAYRVERVGRVEVSFSTPRFDLRSGFLVNLSTTGARLQSALDLGGEFKPGDPILVTLPVAEGLKVNSSAQVCWVQGRALGLKFVPTLPEDTLVPLSRWIFQRREEDRDRAASPAVSAGRAAAAMESRLVLVSSSPELEVQLRDYLTGLPPLHRIAPTMTALREVAPERPILLIFHVSSLGLDERRRLRAFVDTLNSRQPFLLLGVNVEGAGLMELGLELKAAAAFVLGPRPGPFFHRLVQGVLRRHYEGGEGVLAPKDGL